MDKTEKKLCLYSALLIALMMNSAKLLALRENGIVAHYWHFDLGEFSFQFVYNLAFCIIILFLNVTNTSGLAMYRNQKRYGFYILVNAFFIVLLMVVGGKIQYLWFAGNREVKVYWTGYIARFSLSTLMIGIVVRIISIMRDSKKKNIENEQLKNAYMAAELELLKEQMNPHFLFNSLSSLSGVIRENPDLAQRYVRELSNVFRYALIRSENNLVTVEEELVMLRSFAQLINMRLESAFLFDIMVSQPYLSYKIPHLSLQPLLENAVKHNAATISKPLKVEIYVMFNHLVITNNICKIPVPETSNGVGLVNLNERFKIMLQEEIQIERTEELFIVKLPLAT